MGGGGEPSAEIYLGCFSTKDPRTPIYHSPQDMTNIPIWKGESFNQFNPIGVGERWTIGIESIRDKINRSRPGLKSLIAGKVSLSDRKSSVLFELDRARVAYSRIRDRTDSRTTLVCLIPPQILLDESAPTITFIQGDEWIQSIYLGVMNSLPFDWQARRYVGKNINNFMLESLIIPALDEVQYKTIAKSAARLSVADERFDNFAQAVGVEVGPLDDAERQRLRVEIDARVAQAWDLTIDDLRLMFTDFTEKAVAPDYRAALIDRLEDLIL